jgi:hypothetical protein
VSGSLTARVTLVHYGPGVDIEPDACPGPGQGPTTLRRCTTGYDSGEQPMCPYAYGFTRRETSTERITTDEMVRWMRDRVSTHMEVRTLCLLARPADRIGS